MQTQHPPPAPTEAEPAAQAIVRVASGGSPVASPQLKLRSAALRYGCAVISVVLATLVGIAFTPTLQGRGAFFTFFIAVMFTAWYGGSGPALLSIGLGAIIAAYLFLTPLHSFTISGAANRLEFALYLVVGLVSVLLTEAQRKAKQQVEASVSKAQQEVQEHRRAEEALQLKMEEVNLLYEAGRLLGSTLDPDQVYDHLRLLIAESMDCDGLLVSSFSAEEGLMRCTYAWIEGSRVDVKVFPPVPLSPDGRGMQSTVIQTRKSLRVPDVEEREKSNNVTYHVEADGTVKDQPEEKTRTRSLLMVPILLEGHVLGIVQVSCHRKDAYTEEHLRLLEALTIQAAAASRNAFLYRQAQNEIAERRQIEAVLRESETRLRQAAEEVQALNVHLKRSMAETHHRIKNNLQVVSALAEVQSYDHESMVSIAALDRIRMHTHALAGIHDLLTRAVKTNGDTDHISARAVLNKLVSLLRAVAGEHSIHTRIADVSLPIRQATALAMFVNEAVTNAIKHGGKNILLDFTVIDSEARLEVKDDGLGFPSDFDPKHANTGVELMEAVGRWDLGGSVSYTNRTQEGGGAAVIVSFPLPP